MPRIVPRRDPAARRPRGRPRSERCRLAIRGAVAELLEELPYTEISIEAIAARAGVSKQTIYRWWSGKAQLAMEAYAELMATRVRADDTGDLGDDLRGLLRRSFVVLRAPRRAATFAGLVAAAQHDPSLATEFRETYIGVRRRVIAAVLTRAIARGQLPPTTPIPVAIDLLYGPIWYRLLLRNAPLDAAFADELVFRFLAAFAR